MSKENLFYERLLELMNSSHKSMNQIEKELGYPRNALHNYKTGREPSAVRLLELASYFEVEPEYLIGQDTTSRSKSIESIFNTLDFKQKKELIVLCQDWIRSQLDYSNNTTHKVS